MSESDLTAASARERIDAALAEPGLAALRRAGAPIVVFSIDPPEAVFANKAARALFGDDLPALTRRLLHGGEPAVQRIVALARAVSPGAPPRLERLRFFFGPVPETVTVMCRKIADDAGALFAIAALGVRGGEADASAASSSQDDARASQPAEPEGPVRFSWRTGPDHDFTAQAPALEQIVGARFGALEGRSFLALAHELDSSGALAAALRSKDTWSGLSVDWPAEGGRIARVDLGGAPFLDGQRRFAGFRGYGVIHPPVAAPARSEEAGAASARATAIARDQNAHASAEDMRASDEVLIARLHAREGLEEELHAQAPAVRPPAHEALPSAAGHAAAESGQAAQQAAHKQEAETAQTFETQNEQDSEQESAQENEAAPEGAHQREPEHARDRAEHEAERAAHNVVRLHAARPEPAPDPRPTLRVASPAIDLSPGERQAFDEIARALGAEPPSFESAPPAAREERAAPRRARDLIDLVAHFGDAPQAGAPAVAPPAEDAPPPAAGQAEPAAPLHDAAADQRHALAMLDKIPVGVLVVREGATLFANRTLLDLLDYVSLESFDRDGGAGRMFKDGAAPASGATLIVTRAGDELPVDARAQAFDWQGAPATLISLRRAVVAQAPQGSAPAAEDAVIDSVADGVLTFDGDGRVLSLNKGAERLFGARAGESLRALFAQDSVALVQDSIARLKASDNLRSERREIVAAPRGGDPATFLATIGKLAPPSQAFFAALRDIGADKAAAQELAEARREAEKANALKSDFLARVSHEIRTPLNAILGFSEVMMGERLGPLGNERYKDYLKDIHRSGEHVMSLVNDLLDLSKIEAGKMDLSFAAVDANAIVSECVSIMQPQASRERVVVRLSLTPNLPRIVADERSLRQIVLNILSNAVKFNEPGGQVIVATTLMDAGQAVLRVKDTGVGMDESDLETALEPFRQVETARKSEGTGLGLPLTKALVEANRATFKIKSKRGEGTMVEVVFPATRVLAE
ncbi:MAG: PAS domain-containing protein [Hyphomicrobiales bacterium]|nr:PAS domain-containing protein [Hyphomicrobiales bacterium]